MVEGQKILLARILEGNRKRTDEKFRKGDSEHGGELGKKSPLWLLSEALDEATDLAVYLPTLKDALEELKCPHCGERVF